MNYILGGGITGLIWKYYHSEYKIITSNIGGQMANKFNLGPRLLHVNLVTEKLLKELKLSITKKQISVGYGYPTTVMFPNKNFKQQYYIKSRNLKTTNINNSDESVMTGNKNYFPAYKTEMDELVKALSAKINKEDIIQEQIMKIDLQDKTIPTDGNEYKYDKIISTIPKNSFLRLADISSNGYISSSTLFALTTYPESLYIGYNYVYVANDKIPFHRVSKADQKSQNLIFELSEKHDIGDLEKYFKQEKLDIKIIDSIRIARAQIRTNDIKTKLSNIIFSGRYGTWNHSIKTEDVIREAMNYEQD